MAKKKKGLLIRIYSTQGTGIFYNVRKNKNNKDKITLSKYDKKIRRHTKFTEINKK